MKIIFLFIILQFSTLSSVQSIEIHEGERIIFDLNQIKQQDYWSPSDEIQDYCVNQNLGLDFNPNDKIVSKCKNKQKANIEKNCEINNIAYNLDFYFNITKGSKWESLWQKTTPIKMGLDINSPWSWAKAQGCQSCNRQGKNCKAGCPTNVQKLGEGKQVFQNYVNCTSTKLSDCQDQCGQITFKNEGLAVQGKFSDMYVRFGDQKKRIQKFRMLLAQQTAFQQNLLSDGILGLSPQFENQFKNSDSEVNNHMENTGFINNLRTEFELNNQYSLKLAGDPKLIVGKVDNSYAYDLEKFPFKYAELQGGNSQDYFQWGVGIMSIEIMKFHKNSKVITWENRHITDNFENITALVSLSSSALVLPEVHMNFFIEKLKTIYKENCYIDKSRRNFLVCENLESPLELEEIVVYITLAGKIQLHINPKDMVQDCRKMKADSSKYECILEIQQSFNNDRIILGDVVLKNSYIDFDLEKRIIGFTHVRNSYIEEIIKRFENVIVELGEDVISELAFVVRFYFVVIVLVVGFLSLRHGDKIMVFANKLSVKLFNKQILDDSLERQKLTQSEMEMSVTKTDDDEHIGQRIFDMQIESFDQSATFEETNLDEL